MEGNLHFKIDWGSRIVGREFTVFTLFILYLRTISKYKPPGGLYLEGRFNGGFFALRVWGAYIWRGLFLEFYGICNSSFCFTVYDQCVSHMLCIQEIYKPCFARNYVLI